MRLAIAEARRGIGRTSPNPPVGAVIVRDSKVIGTGWHRKAGSPHAEVMAIRDACREDPVGTQESTLYVTLEPCSTHGQTGPCTSAILEAGIRRVVIGTEDPNPLHCGGAEELLRENGVEVAFGIEETLCEELIRGFAKVQKSGLPWIIIKTAMSLDGRITRPAGEGQWLSGTAARAEVQLLRSQCDAILTSGRTVRADDPRLTVRSLDLMEGREQPWRIILTSKEQNIPPTAAVLSDEHRERTLVVAGQRLECVFRSLVSEQGITTILVEAGGQLVGRLLDEEWADEMVVFLTPLVTGGQTVATAGEGAESLSERLRLEAVSFRQIGQDLWIRGLLNGRGGELER